jgi:hypothetical protein
MFAAVLIAAAGGTMGCGASGSDPAQVERQLLTSVSSVQQRANILGRRSAPYTLGFYVAPTSSAMTTRVLPQLPAVITRYVRSGQLKIKVRLLGGSAFGDEADARRASELIQSAGLQSRFWPTFVRFAYSYIGVLDPFAEQDVLRAAGVKDVAAARLDSVTRRVTQSIRRNDAIASLAGSRARRDTYVVANARGVQINVTAQAQDGTLVGAIKNAMKLIDG